jgi:hypothetical protein
LDDPLGLKSEINETALQDEEGDNDNIDTGDVPSEWDDVTGEAPDTLMSRWKFSAEDEDAILSLKLEDQLPKLFQLISISQSEVILRSKVVKNIQEILRKTFSSAYVYSYGNDCLGVALKDDCVRICIDPYGM